MQKSTRFYLGVIGILVLIIMLKDCSGKGGKIKEDPHTLYKTDTIVHKKHYRTLVERIKGLEEELRNTPPRVINIHPNPDPKTITIEKIPDSILVYIEDLEQRIAISDKYLKNYPFSDKLIDFRLTKDHFGLSTLGIDGLTRERKYPLDLGRYDYYWDNNSLNHKEKDESSFEFGSLRNLYINGGYDFFQGVPSLGLDYSFKFNRFKVSTDIYTLFHKPGALLYGDVKLGYRLFN